MAAPPSEMDLSRGSMGAGNPFPQYTGQVFFCGRYDSTDHKYYAVEYPWEDTPTYRKWPSNQGISAYGPDGEWVMKRNTWDLSLTRIRLFKTSMYALGEEDWWQQLDAKWHMEMRIGTDAQMLHEGTLHTGTHYYNTSIAYALSKSQSRVDFVFPFTHTLQHGDILAVRVYRLPYADWYPPDPEHP